MGADRDRLEKLAADMVDGEPIDWETASDPGDPEDTRSAIQSLAQIHRLRRFAEDASTQVGRGDATTGSGPEAGTVPGQESGAAPGVGGHWGHLELREILGQGSQGVVYRAWDPQLERDVALKLDVEDRIVRDEARRLARVRHPHVVQVFGAAEHDGRSGLWMEFVRGRTLADRMAQEGPMSESEAVDLGCKLATALAAIHAVNVVHQDVKARNVMREEGGRFVLMDLGCGADLEKGQSEVGGTPYYMAPELLDGAKPDKRADIYSLGILLYHLVTGGFPYEGHSLREIREQQRLGRPPRLVNRRPELSIGFCRVVERAIDPDPARRYRSAGGFLEELERLGATPDHPTLPGHLGRILHAARLRFVAWPAWLRAITSLALVAAIALGIRAAIPTSPLDVEARLLRISGSTREPLDDGSLIQSGDVIGMELRGSSDCNVYVFGCDDEGGLVRLFPLSYADQQNPLGGEELHRLPGTRRNIPIGWSMSATRGRDRVLVIASAEPLTALEEFARRIRELGGPDSDHNRQVARLRGFESIEEIPDSTARVDEAESAYARLKELARKSDRVWVDEIRLVNAGP